jgi:hypothetical protein
MIRGTTGSAPETSRWCVAFTSPVRKLCRYFMLETIIVILLLLWLLGAFVTPLPAARGTRPPFACRDPDRRGVSSPTRTSSPFLGQRSNKPTAPGMARVVRPDDDPQTDGVLCEQGEWDAMELGRTGSHDFQGSIAPEADAEVLARSDPIIQVAAEAQKSRVVTNR